MPGPRRRDGRPQWIEGEISAARTLARVDLSGKAGSRFDEAWLQELLYRRPELFPIEQIEPGFGALIPVCRELSVALGGGRSGALDNLYLTSSGGLVLVETKLWRNPEARRSAVAQAMEYAAAIFAMSYDELNAAVVRSRTKSEKPIRSMAELFIDEPEFDEAEFVDALTRNLLRGRAIIAVVGDGIREDILPLTELLQSHAGQRFTFALVELAVYEAPIEGVKLVVPSVLAQTVLIERGVVQIDQKGRALIVDASVSSGGGAALSSPKRSVSISEDEFYEVLARKDPRWPVLLKGFLVEAEKLGLYVERKGGLNLKHASPEGQPLNLATISKDGFVETSPSTWWGRTEVGHKYNEALAKAIAGSVGEIKQGTESALRTLTGNMPRLSDLLPAHQREWLDAIQEYIELAFKKVEGGTHQS
ncbi:hypothetical protein [Bradyrhizobium sp. UFLA05-112]